MAFVWDGHCYDFFDKTMPFVVIEEPTWVICFVFAVQQLLLCAKKRNANLSEGNILTFSRKDTVRQSGTYMGTA